MLDIETVRRIANQNGFEEVQYNDVSRVIAFQKGSPQCRVNVYYSTGTVATCLDHPRSGKTQLFRRGQSLDDLAGIFSNPRQHTGVGYFRSKGRESWQPVDGQGRQSKTFHNSECDDARRWRYIYSTQDGFCNDRQADQIAALCKLIHQLRFAPPNGYDIMTTAEKFNSMPREQFEAYNQLLRQAGFPGITICEDCEETGCKCNVREGSHCSILSVLLKIAFHMDGVVGLFRDSEEGVEKIDIRSVDEMISCDCDDGKLFRQRHSTFLVKLDRQFRSFPRNIRRELLHWFLSKLVHGYEPFMINQNYDPNSNDADKKFPVEFYGASYCSNAIKSAHHDYGELTYIEGGKGCKCHGI